MGEHERFALPRKRVRPFPPDLSHRELERKKNSFLDPISVGVEFDDGRGEVIETKTGPVHHGQPLDHPEEVFDCLRTTDQTGAQHVSIPVAQERADLQTTVHLHCLVEQHDPCALSRCGVSPGLFNQLGVLGLLQFAANVRQARDAGHSHLLFPAVDPPTINKAAVERVDAHQGIALGQINASGGKFRSEGAGILAF